jgi:NTE family protein
MPLDGAFYVDGGLRQNTPLSPAIRLGADRVLVISLRRAPAEQPEIREEALPSPFFLAGKTLNALLIDRVDYDLDRLRQMNAILELGEALAGPAFAAELRARIAAHDHGATRIVRDLVVRPSRDLGELAAAYARGPAFARSTSMTARVIRRLAERDPSEDADLLSYLLFDGPFARDLLALGYEDARARRDELAAFFA